jgi:AraC-like DNA-binding protein
LYDLDVGQEIPSSCRVTAWEPAVPGICEVFHAHIAGWRYPAHCHSTWAVLIVDDGAIGYDLDPRAPAVPPPEQSLAWQLRAFLDGRSTTKVTLADAARLLDRTVPHLVRSFTRQFGITPYAYVTGARIEQARKRLLRGEPPAQVALDVGFHDQAHFTRHFKRHVSVPPAQYAASGRQALILPAGSHPDTADRQLPVMRGPRSAARRAPPRPGWRPE